MKYSIYDINKIIEYKNITCISDSYNHNKEILKWKCNVCGFIFQSSKNNIDRYFKICKSCKKIKFNNKAQEVAENHGGICLSQYAGSHKKIKFKCSNNHIFSALYSNIVYNGTWCPYCSNNVYISEEICRAYFNQMFGVNFNKIRPNWLRNDKGFKLELDGFCEELNLAFEHNGEYHYSDMPHWRKSNLVKNYDNIKLQLCKDNNINLIIIPQLFKRTPISELRQYIISECEKIDVSIPYPNIKIKLEDCYNSKYFEIYKDIALKKRGKCLTKEYINSTTKMLWECEFGHQWVQSAYVIKKGHWCPICAGQKQSKNIKMKKLSIVIPVFNKFKFTKSCLNDLSHLPNDHEIIIVDNGSSDETKKELKNSKEIKYIRLEKNNGFGKASNLGVFYSEGDNILFLNNDIRVKSDYSIWTQPLIDKCSEAIVGPTMGQLDNDLNFVQEANKVLPGKSYMSGWCLASSRKIWQMLDVSKPAGISVNSMPIFNVPQIFDEKFFCYFEDTDLSFRARKIGIKFEVINVPVVHFGKQTSRQLNTYQLYKTARKTFVQTWKK